MAAVFGRVRVKRAPSLKKNGKTNIKGDEVGKLKKTHLFNFVLETYNPPLKNFKYKLHLTLAVPCFSSRLFSFHLNSLK